MEQCLSNSSFLFVFTEKTVDRCSTSSVSQHHLVVIHQPAEAGEFHVVSSWRLDCDVPAVPVILHPILLLLNFHQHDVSQVLADP